eukprot:2639854-Pyramimonas_sp.AAC.1
MQDRLSLPRSNASRFPAAAIPRADPNILHAGYLNGNAHRVLPAIKTCPRFLITTRFTAQ